MKVILQHDIPNLGESGDIVEVKNGYARNYLLPRNLVIAATTSNERQKKHQDRLIRLKKDKREKIARQLAEKFTEITCEFRMRVGDMGKLYGSVTSLDIAQNLYDQGYSLDKRKVQLSEPIKSLGEYEVTVKLAQGIESSVKVLVMDLDGNLKVEIKEDPEVQADQTEQSADSEQPANQEELVIEDTSAES